VFRDIGCCRLMTVMLRPEVGHDLAAAVRNQFLHVAELAESGF